MDAVTRWLARQARKQQRVRFLEDALLTDHFGAYARYRLRYFLARYAIASGIHVVKFVLLFEIFSQSGFLTILRFQAVAGLVAAFWWGALEVMRERVRELHRGGRPHLVPREVGGWVALAALAAGAVGAVAAGRSAWLFVSGGGFGAADLYVVAIFVRLAAGLVARCYHSGIYAVRRVYRPLPAMVGIDIGAFVGVLGLWPVLGPWSFPVASLLSTVAITVTTLHYARRSYRFLGLELRGRIRLAAGLRALRGRLGELLAAGLAYAFTRLDSLLILSLFRSGGREAVALTTLFVLFFVISPTIRAGAEWAQLLYFDLKRLDVDLFANLRRRFERGAVRLAWAIGPALWLTGGAIAAALSRSSLGVLLVLLLPFFVARSHLALAQIRAFAERRYGVLIATGCLSVAGFVAVGSRAADERVRLALATVVVLGTLGVLAVRGARQGRAEAPRPLWPTAWLATLAGESGPVRVGSARFAPRPPRISEIEVPEVERRERWRRSRVAEGLAARLGRSGAVSLPDRDRLLWLERAEDRPAPLAWLLREGGGHVVGVTLTDWQVDGRAALHSAAAAGMIRDRPPAGPREVAALRRTFRERFPDGIVCAPDETAPAALARLPASERRSLLHDAAVFARDQQPARRRSRLEVTALTRGSALLLVFITGRHHPAGARAAWSDLVARTNQQLAMEGIRAARHPRSPQRGGGRRDVAARDATGRRTPAPQALAGASRIGRRNDG